MADETPTLIKAFGIQNYSIKIRKDRNRKQEERLFVSLYNDQGAVVEHPKQFSLDFFEGPQQLGLFKSLIQKHIPDFNQDEFLSKHYDSIKELADASLPSPEKKIEQKEFKITENEREEALDILTNGDPLKSILETVDKIHKGDEPIKVLYALSPLTLRLNTGEIHIMLVGKSGKGKKLASKMLNCLPEYSYESWASLSPQTLKYYSQASEPTGKIHHIDEGRILGDGIALIRSLTSGKDFGGLPSKCGVVKDQEYLEINIEGDIIFWINCTRPIEDEDQQLPNRFYIPNVDESRQQDEIVYAFQTKAIGEGVECSIPNIEFKRIKNIYHILLEEHSNVVIPFLGHIEFTRIEDRRLFPMFTRLIKASAKLYQFQRMRTESGEIVATLADFVVAKYIWDNISETQVTKVNKTAIEIYKSIPVGNDNRITRAELSTKTNTPTSTIIYILDKQLLPTGLVNADKEKNRWVYWRSSEETTNLQKPTVLLNVDEINATNLLDIKTEQLTNLQEKEGPHLYISLDIEQYLRIYMYDLSHIPASFVSSTPELLKYNKKSYNGVSNDKDSQSEKLQVFESFASSG